MENLIKNPFTFKYLERIREYINIINASLILNFYILIKNIQNLILLLFDYSL